MNIKYIVGALLSIPLLPVLYFQGKKIRKKIPPLPEASGTEGVVQFLSSNSLQLITIGESTIAGVGVATHEKGFTGTLAKHLGQHQKTSVSWKVYAKSGYTAKQVHDRILPKISEEKVDIIVIGLGGNDSFVLNSPKRWNRDIRELIESLQKKYPKTPLVFGNMPPIKEFTIFTGAIKFVIGNLVIILGKELEKIVKDYDNVYYASTQITYDAYIQRMEKTVTPEDFFSDGVHPSELAYQMWAEDMATFIQTNQVLSREENDFFEK